jgi:hypothetical protein
MINHDTPLFIVDEAHMCNTDFRWPYTLLQDSRFKVSYVEPTTGPILHSWKTGRMQDGYGRFGKTNIEATYRTWYNLVIYGRDPVAPAERNTGDGGILWLHRLCCAAWDIPTSAVVKPLVPVEVRDDIRALQWGHYTYNASALRVYSPKKSFEFPRDYDMGTFTRQMQKTVAFGINFHCLHDIVSKSYENTASMSRVRGMALSGKCTAHLNLNERITPEAIMAQLAKRSAAYWNVKDYIVFDSCAMDHEIRLFYPHEPAGTRTGRIYANTPVR